MSQETVIVHRTTETFICNKCGRAVTPATGGTLNRNHCPHCLHSVHLDLRPGDRRSACRGLMIPVAVWVRDDGEWCLLHRCERCGTIRSNRIAADDNEVALLAVAARPLTRLPFPIERMGLTAQHTNDGESL